MLKRLFVFFVTLLVSCAAIASSSPKKSAKANIAPLILKKDSSQVNVRTFNQAEMNKYRNDPAFDYAEKKAEPTWWDRFWEWVWYQWERFWEWVARVFQKLFGGSAPDGHQAASVIRVVVLILAAVLIIFIIFKLMGMDVLKLLRKKKKDDVDLPYTESLENIHELNFDDALENAVASKNYRLAVRLLYLRCLKQLSDNNLINWKAEKTNYAYLNELTNTGHRQHFSVLTRQFEYVWYGDFPVNAQSFQKINEVFNEFKQQLL